MSHNLIINARQHLSVQRRFLSNGSTLLLWAFWVGLWVPILNAYFYLVHCCGSYGIAAVQLVDTIPAVSLEHAVLALLTTASALLLWTLLPARKLTHAHPTEALQDYARHFQLDSQQIVAGRNSNIVTVHHDEHGNIIGIETRA